MHSEQKLIDNINLHLGLCLKPSEVEDRAVSAVSNVNSNIQATKCIKQHRRKHDAENSGGQETSLLDTIYDFLCYLVPLHAWCHEFVL